MNAEKFNKLIKIVKHSSKAFTKLYKYYFPKIVTFIFTKYKNKSLSEDVAQEFYAKLLNLEIKNYIEHPTAWIFTSCDNIAKDYLKEEKRNDLAYVKEEISSSDSLFEKVLFGEYLAQLDKLDSETKEIIISYTYYGYSMKEIAEKMNLNYNTVRQKYSRGIAKFKKL